MHASFLLTQMYRPLSLCSSPLSALHLSLLFTSLSAFHLQVSFTAWQKDGGDTGSIGGTKGANPLFKDAAANDFNVPNGSPAVSLGFQARDLTVGVGPDW